ncbi:winged helix-turn-helix domain-containing protein [Methanolobus zinderi]|jgi:predicted transcriptional regulator|uniref:Winged helix-turn-helix domain-containing protein n=1 Tax=Methanolobus zinderi TaxID=536044 RepID=A0A7D5E975_9EURY|nr:winged helix-turn-helix domain-containing protein [Methanolobus zinderi]KXS42937.1 MAG: hypothetical protein AWU59_1405 [Methanolobus sp. T82-4]QLC49915.1 winged helix-turn-helix domain-containing protein [Methanolobus zinderi]
MNRNLLDVIFASEKRKNTLLQLREGPKMIEELLASLDTRRQALLPQLKILEENYLVEHQKDAYELTGIGKVIVEKMAPSVDTFCVFDTDIDYWGTRDLSFIPPHLFERINELGKSTIVDIPAADQYDIKTIYQAKSKDSSSLYAITTLLYPNYYDVFSDLIENKVKINLVLSNDLLCKIRTQYQENFEDYAETGLLNSHVYNKKMNFLFVTFDDYYILMRLLKLDGDVDGKLVYFSASPEALGWAKELFNYYLEQSEPVTEI